MNNSYRHVWSAARGAYVIAAETARGRGKAGRAVKAAGPAVVALAAGLALAGPALAQAQSQLKTPTSVVPTGGKTNAYVAPNGVPVVNIDTANAAGISHNNFTSYNVDANGLVLNNTPFTTGALGQSQLAGGILGNSNLKDPAKIIINEVVSTNRSTLAGYTEVYGSRADVIVVNPNGLTCTGCGFINTDRVTLSTGAPVWAADGSLIGFNVSGGDILVNGSGLNASAQQIFDLVARSVRLDGQVNVGGELGIFAGPNQWNYAGRNVTGSVAVSDAKPSYAIDSTALGGMYAGRIRLIATEAGVGVRMLGDAAASADDFTVNAAGKVLVQSHVSAARDLQVTQTGTDGAGQVEISSANATLNASRNLGITAEGGLLLNEASVKAGNNLSVQAQSLSDSSSANATRTANANIDLKLTNAATLSGTSWGAGSHLMIDADSLAITGATLYSGATASSSDRALGLGASHDIGIDTTKLTSTDTLALQSRSGAVQLGAGAQLTSSGNTSVDAATAFTSAGSVLAGADLAIDGASLANSGLLQAQGALNVGAIQPVAVTNAAGGRMLADHMSVNTTTLDNAGTVQATNGMAITASGAVSNEQGGALLDTGAAKDLTLQAASLTNAGAVQSAGALDVTTSGALANSGQLLTTGSADGGSNGALQLQADSLLNTGTIAAAGDANVTTANGFENDKLVQGANLNLSAGTLLHNGSGDASLLAVGSATLHGQDVTNDGTVQAGQSLAIAADHQLTNNNAIQTLDAAGSATLTGGGVTNAGFIDLAGGAHLAATGDTLVNVGNVIAGADLSVSAYGALTNTGGAALLQAGGTLSANAASIVNNSALQGNQTVYVAASTSISNTGSILTVADGGAISVAANSVSNSGTVKAAGSASLKASAGSIDNSGQVTAAHNLALNASQDIDNQGANSLVSADNVTLGAASIANGGTVQADSSLLANAARALTNSGALQTRSGASTLTVDAGTIDSSGSIASSGSASLATTTGTLSNEGQVQSQDALGVSVATSLVNSGNIIGQDAITVGGANGFGVTNSGRIQAAGALGVGSGSGAAAYATNSGTLFGATVGMVADNLTNSGRIQSNGAATLSGGSVINQGSSAVILVGMDGSASTISASGSVWNEGAIHGGGNLTIGAPRLDNTGTGGISSEAALTMNAGSLGFDNSGALYASTTLTVNANGQTYNNNPTGTMDGNDIVVNAGTFNNYNTVIALNDTTINTTYAFNNLPTGRVPNIVSTPAYGAPTTPYYWSGNCNIFGAACDSKTTYAQSIIVTQSLDGPMPTQFGQIIAANTINVSYGQSGLNTASLISAPNVNISGSGSFTNTDLHLEEIDYTRRWRDYKTNSTFGPINHTYTYATSAGEIGGCNDGGCFSGGAGSAGEAQDAAYQMETGRHTIQVWKAGIYATNLYFSGGSLMNLGSPYQQGTATQSVSATSAVGTNPLAGTPFASAFSALVNKLPASSKTVTVPAAPTLQFQGLNLTLPTNPNGYFVTNKDPNSGYLVETNPLFGAGNNSVGSDYLTKLLNINPDQQIKRLGDANYEESLVRSQLIAQTGSNVLAGMQNEANQMQQLMDNAASEASQLGLVYGQAPTAAQLANLKEDMVWMVATVVDGQTVVAPVVFLAQSTKDAIDNSGPVISATNATINAGTVTNTGGTIAGDNLAITAKGDVTNTGGTIKGGNVSVTSTDGSIVNQTLAETHGGTDFARTTIGATGSIQSTGTLNLNAAKDITVTGANVNAGGDASLAAGGKVTLTTIQDKTADSTSRSTESGLAGMNKSSNSTHTQEVTNIGSSLNTGGNLSIKSGDSTTIAGSQVKVGGDLSTDAKGGLNVVSVQDTHETQTSSSHSGLGEGGGLYGSKTTTTDSFHGTNVASGIDVAGNADLKTDGTLTLQGSNLNVGGSANIQADQVQVLAGQDVDRTTTTTKTTSLLKLDGASGGASTDKGAQAGAGVASASNTGVGAQAGAGAEAHGSAGLTLAETSTTTTSDYNAHAVGSQINVGNNLSVNANKDITLQGAKVNAGGDASLNAQNVNVLASQDVHTSSSKTATTQIGLYVDSNNDASASASAHAGLTSNAQAGVEANSDTTVDFARTSTSTSDSLNVHNNGTSISAGGKLAVNAQDQLNVQGSSLSGDKAVDVKAKDMSFTAANDVSTTTTTSSQSAAGLYYSGGASASASASDGVLGGGAQAGAEAKAGEGWQARTSSSTDTSVSTTAQVSSIHSANGDVTRTAQGTISDVGTSIDAGGNVTQSATTIDSKAAANTSYESHSESSQQARVGVYASASAGAGTGDGADASVNVGVEASYSNKQASDSSNSSQAVVSNIHAGGKVSTTSSGTTSMEGTNISGAQGVEIGAQSLNYTAAHDTQSSTSSERNIDASASVGVGLGTKEVEGGVDGGFDKSNASASASTAVTGSIQSGAGLTVKTGGDAHFEGTSIAAQGDATVSAGGQLTMDAAHSTSSSTSNASNFQAGVEVGGESGKEGGVKSAGVTLGGGLSTDTSNSDQAITGSVQSGGKLTLSAGSQASFEGTQMNAGGSATVAAGSVQFKDAKSTSSSSSGGFEAGIGVKGGKEDGESTGSASAMVDGGYTSASQSTSTQTSLQAGGGVQVKTGAAGVAAAAALSAPAPAVKATADGIKPAQAPVDLPAPQAIEAAPQARAGGPAAAPLLADAGPARTAAVSTLVAQPEKTSKPAKEARPAGAKAKVAAKKKKDADSKGKAKSKAGGDTATAQASAPAPKG